MNKLVKCLLLLVGLSIAWMIVQEGRTLPSGLSDAGFDLPALTSLKDSSTVAPDDYSSIGLPEELVQMHQENNIRNNQSLAPSSFLSFDSLLNDKTLPWDPNATREWLQDSTTRPPAMMLLTSVGWNNANQTWGSQIYRGMRMRQLMDGIINHPWFHPTAWQALNDGSMKISNTTRYYVFLDRDTCGEKNFPKYGRGDHANADRAGRGKCCFNTGIYVDPVMHTRLMQIAPHATLILWDCGGAGPKPEFNAARRSYPDRLVFASLSAGHWQLIPNHDLGLPPPAIKPCILTPDERQRIQDCTEEGLRPTLLSFSGAISRSKPRRALKGLHNDKDILIYRGMKQSVKEAFNNTDFGAAYHLLSKQSQFGACPLGDNLFSYRFTEQLSCGTIPVVYADDWVLPFGIELVDWQDAVVLIRERDAARSAEILRMISNETKCAMRRRGVQLFDKYLREGREVIQGMVESLELEANRKHTFTAPIEEVRRRRNNQDSCSGTTARGSSTINDKTLCWDASVQRQWLSATSKTHPTAMLLLTNYGWQNPKARVRRRYHRSVRSRELTEGVVNHPWFHPGAYAKFVNGELPVHPSLTYYIFLDFETCEEGNYPNYLQGVQANLDTYSERAISAKHTQQGVQIGSIMKELGQVFSNVTWRVVYWDCDKSLPKQQWHPNLAVLSISASNDQDSADGSQGLPFPPYRTFNLSSHQRRDIESCRENDRPLLLSFSGHLLSRPRRMLQRLHNGNDVWISHPSNTSLWRNQSDSYFELALQSSFCAIPRGGSLGSSRLVEMMSAGCIPVIFADDWILPLRLIVNWTEVAVVIPEADVLQSVGILRSISTDQRCELRKRAFRVYEEYLSGGSEIVKGVIKGFESRHTLPGASPVGYKCTLMENGASQCVKALNEVEVALLA